MPSCKQLVLSLVMSHLDYMNCLLFGVSEVSLERMQKIQNMCVRTIYRLRKFDHVSNLMYDLHWLPIKFRVRYKIILTVFKCLHNSAPLYLREMLVVRPRGRYNTRSAANSDLVVPRTHTKWGDRSFSCCGPRLWNGLPATLKQIETVAAFKRALKTHLFYEAYET